MTTITKPLPADVLQALQAQMRTKSQAQIARELDVSPATVNNAVKDRFKGHVERFCARVRGKYLAASVACPVLGEIAADTCVAEQLKPIAFTNPRRVALARACKTCPHRQADAPCSKPSAPTRRATSADIADTTHKEAA